MRRKFIFFLITFIFITSIVSLIFLSSLSDFRGWVASVFFTQSITKTELLNKYQDSFNLTHPTAGRIKILIVPGHDDVNFGTAFGNLKEADLNLTLGKELSGFLNKDGNFQVVLVRDDYGFNKEFSDYLIQNEKIISDFIQDKKMTMNNFIRSGEIESVSGVIHNSVPNNIAINLYGINKWANEIGADIVLHIHFNDYPRKSRGSAGDYSGFAIYVPEKQYSNSSASRVVAESVLKQLNNLYPTSDLKKESAGVVEDQDLIAIGAYNTLDAVGLLVEYGYIYEPQFLDAEIRNLIIKDLAYQTFVGIKNFFEQSDGADSKRDTTLLPHTFSGQFGEGEKYNRDVLALQTALKLRDFYPPAGFKENSCPISGIFGPCTAGAVVAFQKAYGISPSSGFVGPLTISKLNRLFSGSIFD